VAKVFDLTVAATGANEKILERMGVPFANVIIHPNNHAGYYPLSVPMTLKLVYDPTNGKVLGAQSVGYDGVEKRIDVIAAYIGKEGTISDLCEFEHAYAPPYSSAKDPINLAAFAAENALRGRSHPISWKKFEEERKAGAFVLDVRLKEEAELGAIPGSVVIPNTELRARLSEVPKDKPILIYCGVGLRGYLAERILLQNGWTDVKNLSGGMKIWQVATERQDNPGAHETRAPKISAHAEPSMARAASDRGTIVYGDGTGAPEGITKSGSGKTIHVDASGLQCPGPIMRLKAEIDKAEEGTRILLTATDPGFARDVQSWCKLTNNLLVGLEHSAGRVEAVVEKASGQAKLLNASIQIGSSSGGVRMVAQGTNGATFIVFSNDMDKALASFVLANGAASVGKNVTMFFTFWGLSVILRKKKPSVSKDLMGRMFSFMLPKHSDNLALSHMNFGGMGTAMMKGRMKSKNVDQLEQMMESALKAGVRMIACQMSMDLMGVAREELMEGVEIGGVATYMEAASESGVNLFI
ncbi:MAG: DsrE/DsrF/DrsH-like family protein, partial [Treponemataceae bacterium]